MRGDRGDVILGWFVKLTLAIVGIGLLLFDGVSVGVTSMSVSDQAATAAGLGADTWNTTHDVKAAYREALDYVEQHGGTIPKHGFTIDPDGTVHVRVDKEATTVLLYRTGATKKWTHVSASGARRTV